MTTIAVKIRHREDQSAERSAAEVLDVGCSRLILAQPFYAADWLRLGPALPKESLLGVELFAPLPKSIQPGKPNVFLLGSPRPEDHRDALKFGEETIRFASEHLASVVFLPSVALERPTRDEIVSQPRVEGAYEFLRQLRTQEAEARLDAYLRDLDRLLAFADRQGVRLAVTPTGMLNQFPDLDELAFCVEEFRGAPLDVWSDTAEQALATSWQPDAQSVWERFEGAVRGVTLRDVDADGLPCLPGQGELEWETVATHLDHFAHAILDPSGRDGAEEIAATCDFLRSFGETEEEDPLFGGGY